jgi:hypothetical protein
VSDERQVWEEIARLVRERDEARAEIERFRGGAQRLQDALGVAIRDRDALATKCERMTAVIEAAKSWRQWDGAGMGKNDPHAVLEDAIDAAAKEPTK